MSPDPQRCGARDPQRCGAREANHPLPHFHAAYGEFELSISIETLEILSGTMPGRAKALLLEWAHEHRGELLKAWTALREGRLPAKIAPLK